MSSLPVHCVLVYMAIIRDGQTFFSKERFVLTFISVHWKWTFRSLRSFLFSGNERFVHYVHFRSVEMNVSFTTFISVQWKWTFCSLRSFPFIKNEWKWMFRSFQLGRAQKSPKMTISSFWLFLSHFWPQKGLYFGHFWGLLGPDLTKWTKRSFYRIKMNVENETFIFTEQKWT